MYATPLSDSVLSTSLVSSQGSENFLLGEYITEKDAQIEAGSTKQPHQPAELDSDCGSCSVSFHGAVRERNHVELGHLVIKPKSHLISSRCDTDLLFSALGSVLATQNDFTVTYDLRKHQPSHKLAMSISRFVHEHKDQWAKRTRSMACLVNGNIFVECARGAFGTFMKMLLPGCPAIVCHSEHIAREFFKANTTASDIGHEFVSVTNVEEDTRLTGTFFYKLLLGLLGTFASMRRPNPRVHS